MLLIKPTLGTVGPKGQLRCSPEGFLHSLLYSYTHVFGHHFNKLQLISNKLGIEHDMYPLAQVMEFEKFVLEQLDKSESCEKTPNGSS